MTTEILQGYLPLFLLLYLFFTFVLPSYRVYRQTGINPVTFGKSDTAHDYIGRLMKVVTGLLLAVVLLFSFGSKGYRYAVPVDYLQQGAVQTAGLVLMHLSLGWILVAQYQMRQAWRIGIDESHPTALVTAGVFRLSRNPVFLGMLLSLLGIFLVLPNALTLVVLVASYILIQVQIRLEEAYLLRQHGQAYAEYRSQVRRLV
ncbi:MAG TPA: isoprenylcysteine carboxylmethyltransferase family protein [Flavisolibacter sp.]